MMDNEKWAQLAPSVRRHLEQGGSLGSKIRLAHELPSWLHDEAKWYAYYPMYDEILAKSLTASGAPRFWETIGRHEFLQDHPAYYSPYSPRLNLVFQAIRYGLTPLAHYDTLTAKQRQAAASKVAQLADELSDQCSLMVGDSEDEGLWPIGPGIAHGLYSYYSADMTASYWGRLEKDYADNDAVKLVRSLSEDDQESIFWLIRHAFLFAVKRAPDLLGALAETAESWGEEEQKLYRPNDPNGQRLLFIRRVTAAFMRAFGKPLREATLFLTGVYFDTGDLDAATLSRLAPVSKKPDK